MKFSALLNERKNVKDFDNVSSDSCVYIKHTVRDGVPYTMCGIWSPIVQLDEMLAKARTVELRVGGINKIIQSPKITEYKVFKGTVCDEEYKEGLDLTVTSVLANYSQWKLRRERFLTGRSGSLYDFDELTPLIGDLATLAHCDSYNSFYNLVYNMIVAWTSTNDTLEMYIDDKEEELKRLSVETNRLQDNDCYDSLLYRLIAGQGAVSILRRSTVFNKESLSFILIKIKEMCEVEAQIEKLREEYLGSE